MFDAEVIEMRRDADDGTGCCSTVSRENADDIVDSVARMIARREWNKQRVAKHWLRAERRELGRKLARDAFVFRRPRPASAICVR